MHSSKSARNVKPIRGVAPSNIGSISNTDANIQGDNTSGKREHRSARVVRNMDHEMPYTTQKLPKQVVDSLKKCKNIINALKKHKCAVPFLRPVDPVQLNCLDYFDIIKEPMDLSTVEKKLRNNTYTTHTQCFDDINKIWNNAFKYNPRNSHVFNLT